MDNFEEEVIRYLNESSKRSDETLNNVASSVSSIGKFLFLGLLFTSFVIVAVVALLIYFIEFYL